MNYLFTTTFACIFCALSTNNAFGQQDQVISHLPNFHPYLSSITSVYGDVWVANNQDAVEALEHCFTNRIKYLTEPLTSNDKYPLLSSFPLMNRYNPTVVAIDYSQFDPATFKPVTYNLPFFSDRKQVIRVDGTNYVIVIDPIVTQH